MIYTVAIGNQIVKNISSISRVETLDESLDYASLILTKELALDTKKMKEIVTITVADNSEVRSYYFLIDSDVSTPVDKDNQKYSRHEISLIELTSRLSDYTVGYRQFTNDTDDLYDVLRDLTQTVFFRNSFINDFSRKIEIDLTHSSLERLKNVKGRDFQFDNNTYFEACVAIMNEVGGFPRVILEGGTYKLTMDLKNERKTLRTLLAEDEKNYKETHNINKYSTVMESYTDNQVFDKTLTGASVVEPSSSGYMPLVSETVPFNSDNAVVRTRYDIRQLSKVKVFFDNKNGSTLEFDMTPRVVAEDVYKGLPNGLTEGLGSVLYDLEGTPAPVDGKVSQKIGTLYFKNNIIENFFTQFFGQTKENDNWFYIINSIYFEEYGDSGLTYLETDPLDKDSQYRYENIRIQVTYVPLFDGVLHAERYNTDDIGKFTMSQSNQSASTVSTEKALKTLGAEINALGNKEIMTTSRVKLLSDEFEVGDYTSDNYILTKKEISYFKDEIVIRYEWDRDYQKRNEDISVNSAIRYYTIPSGGISERQLYYKEYVYVGFDGLTSETTLLSSRGREALTNIFDPVVGFKNTIQNALVTNTDVLTTSNPVILPVISVGGRNVLNFNFGFQSPLVAGERLDTTSQSIPLLEPINYADENGEVEFINFELVDTVTVTDPKALPKVSYGNVGFTLASSIQNQYLVKKDSAETLGFSYQVHLIPNNNIVIGDYLITNNHLIDNPEFFEGIVVYSSDEYYTPQETAKVKGTLEVGNSVTKVDNETISIDSTINSKAWAITTDTGELLLAVNQFDNTQTSVKFNYFNSRNDIDYDFITEISLETPAAPTDLILTSIDFNTVQLDWTDNSTNETNFLIEISEDDVSYTTLSTVDTDITTYTAINLTPDTLYYFRVSSYNQNGSNGLYANNSITTDQEFTPPADPINYIAVSSGTSTIDASWDFAAGLDSYTIEIKKTVDTEYTTFQLLPTDISYQFTGLEDNTAYDTRLKANNTNASSNYVNYSATTDAIVTSPNAASDVTITPADETTLHINWTDNSNNESGFRVQYRLTGNVNWVVEPNLAPNVTFYALDGLDSATEYDVRVIVFNDAGSVVSTNFDTDFTMASYTFSYNGGSGSSTTVKRVGTLGSAIVAPTPSEDADYDFTGWSPAAPATHTVDNDGGTSIAQYSYNPTFYDYTFVYNGGEGANTTVVRTGTVGTTITPPTPTEDQYYTFTGWSPSPPSTHQSSNDGGVSTAQYSYNPPAPVYEYTFLDNGGEGSSTVTVRSGEAGVTITPPTPVPDPGFAFAGWSPSPPATHQSNNDGLSSTAVYFAE